jgi:tripartite-type tricarboxylate transporter receptor subunit TctC
VDRDRCARRHTVIETLNREINAGLASPAIKARYAELNATTLFGSPGEFRNLVVDDTEKWARIVKFSGAKPD